MTPPKNMVGPQVKKFRLRKGLTRPELARRCAELGWAASQWTLSRIEARSRPVADFEVLLLARALEVPLGDLWPTSPKGPKSYFSTKERKNTANIIKRKSINRASAKKI
jgi:transcriptional regulator with XRE-family HTH domain